MLTRIERFGFAGGVKLIFSSYDHTSTNTTTENSIYLSHSEVSKLYDYIKNDYLQDISNFNGVVGGKV